MNYFRRIAAFTLGLSSGFAAGYLSRPTDKRLRNRMIDSPSLEEELANKKENRDYEDEMQTKSRKQLHKTDSALATP